MVCGLLLALGPLSAVAGTTRSVDYFLSLPEVDDEILLVVSVGQVVRAKRSIRVDGAVDRSAYRAAWSSARDRKSRRREANAFALQVETPEAFEPFGGIPVSRVVTEQDIWSTDKVWFLRIPSSDGNAVRSAVAKTRVPRFGRRAVRSLIDTDTGEIVWADE